MSEIVKLRQQGGAAIITVPAHFLRELAISIGANLRLELDHGKLIIEPTEPLKKPLPRRTLTELLAGSEHAAEVYREAAWALKGKPVGREIS